MSIKLITRIITVASLAIASGPASASVVTQGYVSGDLGDITSIKGGLLIRMDDNRVPTSCGIGQGWMKIDQSDTAMISLVLSYWLQAKKSFSIYVASGTTPDGFCSVQQSDPAS